MARERGQADVLRVWGTPKIEIVEHDIQGIHPFYISRRNNEVGWFLFNLNTREVAKHISGFV